MFFSGAQASKQVSVAPSGSSTLPTKGRVPRQRLKYPGVGSLRPTTSWVSHWPISAEPHAHHTEADSSGHREVRRGRHSVGRYHSEGFDCQQSVARHRRAPIRFDNVFAVFPSFPRSLSGPSSLTAVIAYCALSPVKNELIGLGNANSNRCFCTPCQAGSSLLATIDEAVALTKHESGKQEIVRICNGACLLSDAMRCKPRSAALLNSSHTAGALAHERRRKRKRQREPTKGAGG